MQLRDSIEATGSFFLYSIRRSERCDSYACLRPCWPSRCSATSASVWSMRMMSPSSTAGRNLPATHPTPALLHRCGYRQAGRADGAIGPGMDGGQIPTLQIPRNQIRVLWRIPTNSC